MLRIDAGKTGRYCDGMSRRSFVQLGVAGMAALGLPQILRAKAESQAAGGAKKDTSVILLWLDGGPSHMDTYDMKPLAPVEYRGIWSPIKTNVPGIEISELFPKQAKLADKFAIVRSMHHDDGDHFGGGHRMLTGRGGANGGDQVGKYPGIGAIVSHECGPRKHGMPPYVAVPYASSIGLRPGYFGGNYLGPQFDPFETGGDPNSDRFQIQNLNLPGGMTVQRLDGRRGLLKSFDRLRRQVDQSGMMDSMDRFERDAYEMVAGDAAREAFDLSKESPETRERYGRNSWGQSTLLCRRLVEAGATFATAHFGGWDHHWNLQEGMERLLPQVDALVSALVTDLYDRGLDRKTLVVLCGEFSRTPKMNDGSGNGTPGRDHWGNSMSVFLAGGGLKMGQAVGSTDAKGERPLDRPLTPGDLHATIYKLLGVDPTVHFVNFAGRPVAALDEGKPIAELF